VQQQQKLVWKKTKKKWKMNIWKEDYAT